MEYILVSNTKDDHIKIKFNDRNQVYDKIAWGEEGGGRCFHSSFVS